MPFTDSHAVTVSRRGPRCLGSDPRRTVVRLCGEHDIATRARLSTALDEATELDDADVVVDLSDVTFMDASTIGALVTARNELERRSRSLSVADPSSPAKCLFDLCGLSYMVEDATVSAPTGLALSSWVRVPVRDRTVLRPSVELGTSKPERERVAVGCEASPPRTVEQRRAPP